MTKRSEYSSWTALRDLYLEDSYVLEIIEDPPDLSFQMEFVLREGHPEYQAPRPNEPYCYRRGTLIFRDLSELRWLARNDVLSFDATGERDLGNIDQLYCEDGYYTASGDWGRVTFRAQQVLIKMPLRAKT